jgi:hypothetical protein
MRLGISDNVLGSIRILASSTLVRLVILGDVKDSRDPRDSHN